MVLQSTSSNILSHIFMAMVLLRKGWTSLCVRTDVEVNPPEQNGCVNLRDAPALSLRKLTVWYEFHERFRTRAQFFMFSLVSVLNIFIFFIGVCFFPQDRCLTHYNLWLQLLLEKTNEAFARLVQILRVAAEAAGRFSPHKTLFIMGMLFFSWAISEKCQRSSWTAA